jgi:hypothetical protein
MNIKLIRRFGLDTDEYMGRSISLWLAPYIQRFDHVTDKYMCPIFVDDVAEPTNIGGTGQMGTTHLYSLVNRRI